MYIYIYSCFPCRDKYCEKLNRFCCLFPPPAYGSLTGNHLLFFRTRHALGTSPGEFPDCSDYGKLRKSENLVAVCLCPEGCFRFMNFFKVSIILKCDPRAPRNSRGSLGVRRNLANTHGASQVSLRPVGDVATVLVFCFDPGAFQGPCGPLGVSELFLGTLVVNRATLRAPQGSLGPPGDLTAHIVQATK